MSRRKRIPKELQGLYRKAKKRKWSVEHNDGGHLVWTPPGGQAVLTGSTPTPNGHAFANARQRLIKAGLR